MTTTPSTPAQLAALQAAVTARTAWEDALVALEAAITGDPCIELTDPGWDRMVDRVCDLDPIVPITLDTVTRLREEVHRRDKSH
jgi:hypothetical protein